MGIKEDRNDFNNTGLRGVLKKVMEKQDEGFVRILERGWRGEEVPEMPAPGSGAYLHYVKGYPVLKYFNATANDQSFEEFIVSI